MDKDYFDEEIEYTPEEEAEVIQQLDFGLLLGELQTITTKKKLKDWFGNIALHKKGEYCPNITNNDLVEIAKLRGFKVNE